MWIYGFHPVREALRSQASRIERVLLSRGSADSRARQIVELCEAAAVPCRRVEASEISRRVGGVHNGIAAEVSGGPRESCPEQEIVVLVEDIQDPRNLGALIRICDAVGVDRVLIRDRGSADVTPAVVKTSAGAAEWVRVERVTNSANEIDRLKKDGFWVYGAAEGGLPPWELDLTGKVLLCVGGEEDGLRRRTRQICDELVGLPMAGRVESLNLATAAAAILYEIVRQRVVGSVD